MKTIDNMLIINDLGGAGKSDTSHLILQLMKLRNRRGITQSFDGIEWQLRASV